MDLNYVLCMQQWFCGARLLWNLYCACSSGFAVQVDYKNVMLNARAVVLPCVSVERNNTSEWNKPHLSALLASFISKIYGVKI